MRSCARLGEHGYQRDHDGTEQSRFPVVACIPGADGRRAVFVVFDAWENRMLGGPRRGSQPQDRRFQKSIGPIPAGTTPLTVTVTVTLHPNPYPNPYHGNGQVSMRSSKLAILPRTT